VEVSLGVPAGVDADSANADVSLVLLDGGLGPSSEGGEVREGRVSVVYDGVGEGREERGRERERERERLGWRGSG